jgi:hypothetical protein
MTGLGLTKTFTSCAVPGHPFKVGMTEYVTVWLDVVVLISTSLIIEVFCCVVLSPFTEIVAVATQENVVPGRLEVNGKFTPLPLQMVTLLALETEGLG